MPIRGRNNMKCRNDLLVSPKENAIAAVKAGKKEEAIAYIEELSQSFTPMHDRFISWIAYLLGVLGENLGEETVEQTVHDIGLQVYGSRFSMFNNMSSEDIVK
jgi:hypothetical protein